MADPHDPSDPRSASQFNLSHFIVCPHCDHRGVQVSGVILNGARHLHHHCSCCRHVWIERERRSDTERLVHYQPPMVK